MLVNKNYVIVGTYDGTTANLYVNGELSATSSGSFEIKPSILPFLLGANPELEGNHSNYANIKVYQAAIYNRR